MLSVSLVYTHTQHLSALRYICMEMLCEGEKRGAIHFAENKETISYCH